MSLSVSDPEAALGFVADQHVALNRLAQKELLEPDGNLDSARERAQRALGDDCGISQGDIRSAEFGSTDAVVILDVLHYMAEADQIQVEQ